MRNTRHLLLITMSASLAGCNPSTSPTQPEQFISDGRPATADIRAIEKAIVKANDSCIADINRWVRSYRFRHWNGGVDHRYVTIRFSQPQDSGRGPGVYADYANNTFMVDDRNIVSAFGIFDGQHRRIDYWRCGPNLRKPGSADEEPMQRRSILVD
jgi:hypothetical protein